jgi:hypothetical protein
VQKFSFLIMLTYSLSAWPASNLDDYVGKYVPNKNNAKECMGPLEISSKDEKNICFEFEKHSSCFAIGLVGDRSYKCTTTLSSDVLDEKCVARTFIPFVKYRWEYKISFARQGNNGISGFIWEYSNKLGLRLLGIGACKFERVKNPSN